MSTQTRLFVNEYPKRPSRHSASVLQRAAELLLPDVVNWNGESNERLLPNLVEAMSFGDDGYEIAKFLERRGWIPDSELVEILDSTNHCQYKAHTEEVEAWVKNHDIQLQLKIGDIVEANVNGKKYVGEIVTLYPKTAQYTVRIAELGHHEKGGFVLGFEDVTKKS